MDSKNEKKSPQKVLPGYLLQLKAKEDKGEEIAKALRETITNIEKEEGTIAWFGFRSSETDFGTFDVFTDEEARLLHREEGMERVKKLFPLVVENSIVIKEIDIISYKLQR
jgi:quinol monooxygenase YgiN